MKPSERIFEKISEFRRDLVPEKKLLFAILEYLDEEWEKKEKSDEIFKKWALETQGIKL